MKKILLTPFLVASCFVFGQTSTKNVVTDKIPGSDCDNVVHNTLPPDAENRSPSECEARFDWNVRTVLRNAFSKTLQAFPGSEWEISDTAVEQLSEIGKGSERSFFSLSYYFKIDIAPQSPVYKDWYEKYQAHMEALRNPNEETYKKFQDFFYRMNNAIHIRFYITVNSVSYSIYFMKGGQQQLVIPGAAYAVKGSKTGALTGGGEEKAMDACLILFGNQKPVIKPEADGGASIYQENSFPKNTSHLTVQHITVRIECNDELLNRIIKETDWNAIHDMIAR